MKPNGLACTCPFSSQAALQFAFLFVQVCLFHLLFLMRSKLQDTKDLRLAQKTLLPLFPHLRPRSTWRLPALALSPRVDAFACPSGPALWSSYGLGSLGGLGPTPVSSETSWYEQTAVGPPWISNYISPPQRLDPLFFSRNIIANVCDF